MAVKKSNRKSTKSKVAKSRVSSTAKKSPFVSQKMGVLLGLLRVAVVVVSGIALYYNSFAATWTGTTYNQTVRDVYWASLQDGTQGRCIETTSSGKWCTGPRYKFNDTGFAQWRRQNDGRCATVWPRYSSGKDRFQWAYLSAGKLYRNGQEITIAETDRCDAR